jgi:hypothetical protein
LFRKSERRGKVNEFETELIQAAYNQLRKELGTAVCWKKIPRNGKKSGQIGPRVAVNGKEIHLHAKKEIGGKHVDPYVKMKTDLGDLLVVADYIAPHAKAMLKTQGINYVDTKGNMWLRMDQVHIHIEGIPNPVPQPNVRTRLFGKAGIQVLFWLLQDPKFVNESYRAIAARANVALGNIPILFQALQEEGFLVKINDKKWALIAQEQLLDMWVREFGRRLKPAQLIGRFRATRPDFRQNWKELELQNGDVWGGEAGGDLLTNYLVPEAFTLYTSKPKGEAMKNYRWIPDPNGNIFIFAKFWNDQPELDNKAKPLLAYADLVEGKDDRGVETARLIYDQYFRQE